MGPADMGRQVRPHLRAGFGGRRDAQGRERNRPAAGRAVRAPGRFPVALGAPEAPPYGAPRLGPGGAGLRCRSDPRAAVRAALGARGRFPVSPPRAAQRPGVPGPAKGGSTLLHHGAHPRFHHELTPPASSRLLGRVYAAWILLAGCRCALLMPGAQCAPAGWFSWVRFPPVGAEGLNVGFLAWMDPLTSLCLCKATGVLLSAEWGATRISCCLLCRVTCYLSGVTGKGLRPSSQGV